MQDRGQRRSGIFDVGVNAAGEQRLLADVTSGEIEAALDAQMGARFQMLRQNFSEKRLLGKILRADDDGVGPATRRSQSESSREQKDSSNGMRRAEQFHRDVTAQAAGGVRAR